MEIINILKDSLFKLKFFEDFIYLPKAFFSYIFIYYCAMMYKNCVQKEFQS